MMLNWIAYYGKGKNKKQIGELKFQEGIESFQNGTKLQIQSILIYVNFRLGG